MSKHSEVIAIIPARGGSKGLPRKNIADLSGKPLIAYSIMVALYASLIDRVVVSTEDEEIADVAKVWGAEVPFLRPKEYAKDDSYMGEAIKYTINKIGGLEPDKVIVTLLPTSPFRTPAFIDDMLRKLSTGYNSISTVKKINMDSTMLFTRDEKTGRIQYLTADGASRLHWKKYFRPYGTFYAYQAKSNGKHYFQVITDKCMLIDIDTAQDLRFAEAVIKKGLFDFGY